MLIAVFCNYNDIIIFSLELGQTINTKLPEGEPIFDISSKDAFLERQREEHNYHNDNKYDLSTKAENLNLV
jgi:hypothetical protein